VAQRLTDRRIDILGNLLAWSLQWCGKRCLTIEDDICIGGVFCVWICLFHCSQLQKIIWGIINAPFMDLGRGRQQRYQKVDAARSIFGYLVTARFVRHDQPCNLRVLTAYSKMTETDLGSVEWYILWHWGSCCHWKAVKLAISVPL
jgi:hypothetical protein